jgi:hypothetical protein
MVQKQINPYLFGQTKPSALLLIVQVEQLKRSTECYSRLEIADGK